ncbi:hypothetical protein EDF78_10266 [Rahnella sp. BIGb0236]|uniref:hypothetical protein n=1 Tax=Rahnella sp. BIGb0236 TaxID=2485117 RepID=UPI00105DDA4F|nr:hypothetical protein [Rahnella sp. BIGb0236]TDS96553.1 hypothetical protein EDF78_10266 [Rahnella sp. BIGb0236]
MTKSEFDATSSLLGYIYQVRLALLLALTKVTENEDPDIHFVSIEKLGWHPEYFMLLNASNDGAAA